MMIECYKQVEIPRLEKCKDEEKGNALIEHSDYLSPLTGGFSFNQCSG